MVRLNHNILLLQFIEIVRGCSFILPIITLLLQNKYQLSFDDFLFCQAVFAGTILLLEVPSGYLSDLWQRKFVLFLSLLSYAVAFLCLLSSAGLASALLYHFFLALSSCLLSGTNSALLYDTLLTQKAAPDYGRHEGRRRAFGLYSAAISCLLGGGLYHIWQDLPLFLNMGLALIGACSCLFLTEPPRTETTNTTTHQQTVHELAALYRSNLSFILILLASAALLSTSKLLLWSQQAYYNALNLPPALFGVLCACGFFLGGAASHISHFLHQFWTNAQLIFIGYFCAFIAALSAGISISFLGIPFLLIGGSFLFGFITPRLHEALNHQIGTKRRATMLSLFSLCQNLIYIPLSLLIAAITDTFPLTYGLMTISLWLFCSGLLFFLLYHRILTSVKQTPSL